MTPVTIKHDIDRAIDDMVKFHSPDTRRIARVCVDCSPLGGKRIFGGDQYRGYTLVFVGKSRAAKLREETEREESFKAAQQDAFQPSASNEGPQT